MVTFFLIFFLVMGIVGYVGWFFTDEGRGFIGMVGSWCCGFTMVTCGMLLYMHWFRGLEIP